MSWHTSGTTRENAGSRSAPRSVVSCPRPTSHRAQSLRRHREAWLLASRGLAQEGAFALARQGRPEAAVVRLERGRAVLLSEELGLVPALLTRLPAPLRERYSDAVRRVREALRDAG